MRYLVERKMNCVTARAHTCVSFCMSDSCVAEVGRSISSYVIGTWEDTHAKPLRPGLDRGGVEEARSPCDASCYAHRCFIELWPWLLPCYTPHSFNPLHDRG